MENNADYMKQNIQIVPLTRYYDILLYFHRKITRLKCVCLCMCVCIWCAPFNWMSERERNVVRSISSHLIHQMQCVIYNTIHVYLWIHVVLQINMQHMALVLDSCSFAQKKKNLYQCGQFELENNTKTNKKTNTILQKC